MLVILDIFSRFVVGWLLAPRESAELAQQLIADRVSRHDVHPGMPTLRGLPPGDQFLTPAAVAVRRAWRRAG